MKKCPDCGEQKSLDEFPKYHKTRDGRGTYCKPCHNLRNRESKQRNGGNRRYHMRQRYGIEPSEIASMIAAQKGLCAICKRNPAVQVDHDHNSPRFVRGILCDGCNGGIGLFHDQVAIMLRAIDYLNQKEND